MLLSVCVFFVLVFVFFEGFVCLFVFCGFVVFCFSVENLCNSKKSNFQRLRPMRTRAWVKTCGPRSGN